MQRSELPDVLYVSHVAEFLGLSKSTTYAALKNGQIPCRRVGCKSRISKIEFLDWFDGGAFSMRRKSRDAEVDGAN